MANSFDLNLLPLARQAGQDQSEIPGLYVAEPPRRPARGRGLDRLILYLELAGNDPLSPGKQGQILARLAKTFYDTSGSVTATLRTVADSLNKFLLDRNLRSSNTGRQSIGLLSLVAMRGDQLYLAQSGPVHAFLITAGQIQHIYDPPISGRGLGLSRATPIRYFQATLQPNDTLLLSAQPPSTWSEAGLAGTHGQGPESLRRRLLNRNILDVSAVLIQARQGPGKVNLLRSLPASQAVDPVVRGPETGIGKAEQPAQPRPMPEVVPVQAPPAKAPTTKAPPESVTVEETIHEPEQHTGKATVSAYAADSPATREAFEAAESPRPASEQAPTSPWPEGAPTPVETNGRRTASPSRPKFSLAPLWRALFTLGRPFAGASRQAALAGKTLFSRMLPGEALFTIPSTMMAFIAIAVPLVVVTVASMVYFERGRDAQYNLFFAQAEQEAGVAAVQVELGEQRTAWEKTISYLDQAERFRTTAESQSLRRHVQDALDQLELIRRPDYRPAIVGGLPAEGKVTQMAVGENELYMLDANSGSVWRAEFSSQGYILDRSFQCGPDQAKTSALGPLIDIAAWPPGIQPEASLLAMDAAGNVVFCAPDKDPEVLTLAPPPAMELKDLVAFALDLDDLYVLDPSNNAVWVYWNSDFKSQPQFFFGEQIPLLLDVVDLTVNNDDLYLLHTDSHLTLCVYSGFEVAPTRCTDPVPYVDLRPGRENSPLVPASPFTQIRFSPPPDPSLYLLEPQSQALYHFSLRNLAFQRQFLPYRKSSSKPATAFAVNQIERTFFLAIGNEVYYASIP